MAHPAARRDAKGLKAESFLTTFVARPTSWQGSGARPSAGSTSGRCRLGVRSTGREASMTRFALILGAVLVIGSPLFAQQSQSAQPPQPPRAQSLLLPLPKLIPPALRRFRAEPIPAWNIHGHAEVIPSPHVVRPLETRSWNGARPVSPRSSLRVEKTTAAANRSPQRLGNAQQP